MTPTRDFDPATVPVRAAATVMLVRDVPDTGTGGGIEVFMLRRTLAAAFGSGMYVFPGGRVEPADIVGEGDAAIERAHRLAAIRECFEEAGVLLAHEHGTSNTVSDGHPALAARGGVHDGSIDLLALCREHGLEPAIEHMVWVSHWITPVGESRRFDTRFYLVPAPEGQSSRHDDSETIASLWIRPAEAMRRALAGELTMMPPTIKNLQFIEPFDTVAEAMARAAELPPPERILPKLRYAGDGRPVGVLVPGDEGYDASA